eukprot:scaffold13373_cov102-Isochrysis_galbana.AAC.7
MTTAPHIVAAAARAADHTREREYISTAQRPRGAAATGCVNRWEGRGPRTSVASAPSPVSSRRSYGHRLYISPAHELPPCVPSSAQVSPPRLPAQLQTLP